MTHRLLIGSLLVILIGAGCAKPPEPHQTVVLRSPSEAIPAYLRELVADKTIYLNVPSELRSFAIDYFRAAGASVVDSGQAELTLDTSWRSETVYYPMGLRVSGSNVAGQNAIVDVELKRQRPDGSRQIILRGRGEAAHDGRNQSRAIDLAGRRAIVNLH